MSNESIFTDDDEWDEETFLLMLEGELFVAHSRKEIVAVYERHADLISRMRSPVRNAALDMISASMRELHSDG